MNKPFIDHLRFGKYLGFPDCCIDFFRRFNDWKLYSHPFETLKNTKKIKGKAIGSYYCNNLLMDESYFFIHHLPCSFRCESTIAYAKKLEEKIREVEPDYVNKTIELLKSPFLVFGEKDFVIFKGKLSGEKSNYVLEYDDCNYFRNLAREEDSIDFFDPIKAGNKIFIDNSWLIIMKNNSVLKKIKKKEEWFAIDFD